ncbi:MAG TPA: hypothetical protein VIT67_18415 [Povalibacter sp.]
MTDQRQYAPEPGSAEDLYKSAIAIREAISSNPRTRSDAQNLLHLAMDFDARVAEARARDPELLPPSSVRDIRSDLAAKQRLVLAAIATRFFSLMAANWKRSGLGFVAIFSLVGYLYAYFLFDAFGIPIHPYLQGPGDLALIGFLGGLWPMAVLLLLTVYLTVIHFAARSAGRRQQADTGPIASSPWINTLILVNGPAALALAIGAAGLILFAGIPVLTNTSGEVSRGGALRIRIDPEKLPVQVARLLGSTSEYVFAQLPSIIPGETSGVAIARSTVECIEAAGRGTSLPLSMHGLSACAAPLIQPAVALVPPESALEAPGFVLGSADRKDFDGYLADIHSRG